MSSLLFNIIYCSMQKFIFKTTCPYIFSNSHCIFQLFQFSTNLFGFSKIQKQYLIELNLTKNNKVQLVNGHNAKFEPQIVISIN